MDMRDCFLMEQPPCDAFRLEEYAGSFDFGKEYLVTYTGDSPVRSVNGKMGDVSLDKDDIGLGNVDNVQQYSASNPPPYPVTKVNTKTGEVVLDKNDVGLGNVANERQYSADNPPPYPVTSVNGQTGDVTVESGGSPTLLWTNTSPASSYADGNLPLSLSEYSWVVIEYSVGPYFSIRSEWFPVPTLPPPTGYSAYNQLCGVYQNGSNAKMAKREFQVSTSGISFSSGVRVDAYATNQSTSTDNSVCRPLRIWGVK